MRHNVLKSYDFSATLAKAEAEHAGAGFVFPSFYFSKCETMCSWPPNQPPRTPKTRA